MWAPTLGKISQALSYLAEGPINSVQHSARDQLIVVTKLVIVPR